MSRPPFESLPLDKSDPPFAAWGLYGRDDELGTLNLLTEETVLAAKAEIIMGKTISLNLPLNMPLVPMNPDRKPYSHSIKVKPHANDDELTINTQGSSHWDGLRHVGYLTAKKFYNNTTQEDISGSNPNHRCGIQAISRKSIVGRGVLLDYRRWANKQGVTYNAFTTHRIKKSDLVQCARDQQTVLKFGDILLIRTGWTEDYLRLDDQEKQELARRPQRQFVGVENSLEMAQWHWDTGFAAVAGDTNAYEAWPPDQGSDLKHALHEVFLAGWGMPIGEVWDLERLAEECQRQKKWSFFLTSQPLDVPGGIASPSNALAIL